MVTDFTYSTHIFLSEILGGMITGLGCIGGDRFSLLGNMPMTIIFYFLGLFGVVLLISYGINIEKEYPHQ